MTEQMKYIFECLNQEPFNKSFNLISFDQLDNIQLLQILSDVFAHIEQKDAIDIRAETPDHTFARFSLILRILKYTPTDDVNTFRNGLVAGEKQVIYPILEWMFRNMEVHKKRAYLARYLLKVEVPPEMMDQELMELYKQYEEIMEQFKVVHKEHEQLKEMKLSAQEVRKDIANMEEEKETLTKRVEKLKKKVDSMTTPKKDEIYVFSKQLRMEKEKEAQYAQQRHEQKNAILQLEQRFVRLTEQLKQLKQSGIDMTPENLIKRLEEENKAHVYLVNEKLPRQLADKKASVQNLQKIVSEPALSQNDLDEIMAKIKECNQHIAELTEKRMMHQDPEDEKLALFRQQANIIARKKDEAAERLNTCKAELQGLESQMTIKRGTITNEDGDIVLKGEDFRRYVAQLRGKSNVYKKKRQEIQEIRAEIGVLSRTEQILQQKDEALSQQLQELEERRGVSGYRDTAEQLEEVSSKKSAIDDKKGKALHGISDMVKALTIRINEKKSQLAPLIKELRPMRQKEADVRKDWEEKKERYDSMAAGLESHRSRLEQEVRQLRDEVNAEESGYHYSNAQRQILEVKMEIIESEAKLNDKSKSFRERLNKLIQEEESQTSGLREKMNSMKDAFPQNVNQMKMWKDFSAVVSCKLRLQHQVYNVSQGGPGHAAGGHLQAKAYDYSNMMDGGVSEGADRLVIQ